jgi:hypothetical protein
METLRNKIILLRTSFAIVFSDCKFKAIATAVEATTQMKTQTTSFTNQEFLEFLMMKARAKQIKNSLKVY